MIDCRLQPEIYCLRSLSEFSSMGAHAGKKRFPIPPPLDTGMPRLGFMEN